MWREINLAPSIFWMALIAYVSANTLKTQQLTAKELETERRWGNWNGMENEGRNMDAELINSYTCFDGQSCNPFTYIKEDVHVRYSDFTSAFDLCNKEKECRAFDWLYGKQNPLNSTEYYTHLCGPQGVAQYKPQPAPPFRICTNNARNPYFAGAVGGLCSKDTLIKGDTEDEGVADCQSAVDFLRNAGFTDFEEGPIYKYYSTTFPPGCYIHWTGSKRVSFNTFGGGPSNVNARPICKNFQKKRKGMSFGPEGDCKKDKDCPKSKPACKRAADKRLMCQCADKKSTSSCERVKSYGICGGPGGNNDGCWKTCGNCKVEDNEESDVEEENDEEEEDEELDNNSNDVEYTIGPDAAMICPNGFELVTDEQECRDTATSSLVKTYGQTGCWAVTESGCLWNENMIYFSTCGGDSQGGNHYAVCKTQVTSTTTASTTASTTSSSVEYQIGPDAAMICPNGFELVTDEQECRNTATSSLVKTYGQTGCWTTTARGCIWNEDMIYFSNCGGDSQRYNHYAVCKTTAN